MTSQAFNLHLIFSKDKVRLEENLTLDQDLKFFCGASVIRSRI